PGEPGALRPWLNQADSTALKTGSLCSAPRSPAGGTITASAAELVSWLNGAASGSSAAGDPMVACDPARRAGRPAAGDHGSDDGRPVSGTARQLGAVSRISAGWGAKLVAAASRWAVAWPGSETASC